MATIAELALRVSPPPGPEPLHARLFDAVVREFALLGGLETESDPTRGFRITFCDGSRLECRPDRNGGQPYVNRLRLVPGEQA